MEAFLELVVEAMEALDRLELKKGNLLKGIHKKTIRREGIICLKMV